MLCTEKKIVYNTEFVKHGNCEQEHEGGGEKGDQANLTPPLMERGRCFSGNWKLSSQGS